MLGNVIPVPWESSVIIPGGTDGGSEFIFKIKLAAPYGDSNAGGEVTNGKMGLDVDPSYTYDFNVDWGDGNTDSNVTAAIVHQYPDLGDYTIKITGTYPKPVINYMASANEDFGLAMSDIVQWGNQKWKSLKRSFGNNTIGLGNTDPNNSGGAGKAAYAFKLECVDLPDLSELEADGLVEMFYGCNFLGINNIENWTWSNSVDSLEAMFYRCDIWDGDVSAWNVDYIKTFKSTFHENRLFDCGNAHFGTPTPLNNLTGWAPGSALSNVDLNFESMFYYCTELDCNFWQQDSYLSNVNTINCQDMFYYTIKLKLNLAGWSNTSTKINNIVRMFSGVGWYYAGDDGNPDRYYTDDGIKTDFSNWDFNSNKTSLEGLFQIACFDNNFNCNLDGKTVTNITNFSNIFNTCYLGGANSVDNWVLNTTVGANINLSYAFAGRAYNYNTGGVIYERKGLDWRGLYGPAVSLNGWDVSAVTSFDHTFSTSMMPTGVNDCKPIFGDWTLGTDPSMNITLRRMFLGSTFNDDLVNDPVKWDVSRVNSISYTFAGSSNQNISYFNQSLSTWDTSNVEDMSGFVYYNSGFTQDISHFDMSKVTNINRMFDRTQNYPLGFEWMQIPLLTGNNERFQYQWDFDTQKYTDMLNAWGAYYYSLATPPTNVELGMNTIGYWGVTQYFTAGLNTLANGMTTREYLTTATASGGLGWTINDGGGI
jgi:hypothetical protein